MPGNINKLAIKRPKEKILIDSQRTPMRAKICVVGDAQYSSDPRASAIFASISADFDKTTRKQNPTVPQKSTELEVHSGYSSLRRFRFGAVLLARVSNATSSGGLGVWAQLYDSHLNLSHLLHRSCTKPWRLNWLHTCLQQKDYCRNGSCLYVILTRLQIQH